MLSGWFGIHFACLAILLLPFNRLVVVNAVARTYCAFCYGGVTSKIATWQNEEQRDREVVGFLASMNVIIEYTAQLGFRRQQCCGHAGAAGIASPRRPTAVPPSFCLSSNPKHAQTSLCALLLWPMPKLKPREDLGLY